MLDPIDEVFMKILSGYDRCAICNHPRFQHMPESPNIKGFCKECVYTNQDRAPHVFVEERHT